MLFNFWRRTTAAPYGDLAFEAEQFLAAGQYEQALAAFAAELRRPDLSAKIRAHLFNRSGVAAVRSGDLLRAHHEFLAAVAAYAKFAPALTNLGNVELDGGRLEAAVEYYQQALRADEHYALAHHHLGVAYRRMGRLRESVRALRRAWWLEVSPLRRQSKRL